ncbi:MAG TPA: hypothetical protein VLE20_12580 [Blastocatellia bacterium]|nr:hypothetical protein [Blastocatellia bacterium]
MRTTAATPFGIGTIAIPFPKVAEYGNLGLRAATPLGLGPIAIPRPKVAEYAYLGP